MKQLSYVGDKSKLQSVLYSYDGEIHVYIHSLRSLAIIINLYIRKKAKKESTGKN